MEMPVAETDWLLDEDGAEYRLDPQGEPDFRLPEPRDPDYDAWVRADVEAIQIVDVLHGAQDWSPR